jgi:hypothetical protein
VVWPAAAALAARPDPLRVPAQSAFQCLVRIWVLATRRGLAVDDILGAELADCNSNGSDDVAVELFALAEVLALESELVLFGHVVTSSGADLVHDVQQNGLWTALTLSSVLGRVANVSAGYVHGAIGGEGDAVRKLLAPACCKSDDVVCNGASGNIPSV